MATKIKHTSMGGGMVKVEDLFRVQEYFDISEVCMYNEQRAGNRK